MKTYSLTDARNRHGEVFDQAILEPVLLTKQSRPSHVVLSAKAFQKMTEQLEDLEDALWGQAAAEQLNTSQMVGSDTFSAELEKLANG